MVDADIVPETCSTSFAHPSGHAITSCAFYLYLYLEFYYVTKKGKLGKLGQTIGLILVAFISAIIGYSRVYFEVHTFDNLIFSWTLAVWFSFSFFFILR